MLWNGFPLGLVIRRKGKGILCWVDDITIHYRSGLCKFNPVVMVPMALVGIFIESRCPKTKGMSVQG